MFFILYSLAKRKYNSAMIQIRKTRENGSEKSMLVIIICLIICFVGVSALSVWLYMSYTDQKNNVEDKVSVAVAVAEKKQADIDEVKFAQRDKEPLRQFIGPEDYGRLTFSYPKTWSTYINNDGSKGGTFEAYLNPITVPPISANQQFALRVSIQESDYGKVISTYDSLVKKGDLKSTSVSVDGNSGTRLDGAFSKDIRGSAVIYKIRDKTVTIRTDATTFTADFNALITTLKWNN